MSLDKFTKVVDRFRWYSVSQREAARSQIERACVLMLENQDFISVVTLACAADGILGGHLLKAGHEPMVTVLKRVLREKYVPEMTDQELNDKHINGVRNFLKHHREKLDEPVEMPLEQEAINALMRAIYNYAMLSNEVTDPMGYFLIWLKENHGELLDAADSVGL